MLTSRELRAATEGEAERSKYRRRTKRAQMEISQLEGKPRAAAEQRVVDEPETGVLPD